MSTVSHRVVSDVEFAASRAHAHAETTSRLEKLVERYRAFNAAAGSGDWAAAEKVLASVRGHQ